MTSTTLAETSRVAGPRPNADGGVAGPVFIRRVWLFALLIGCQLTGFALGSAHAGTGERVKLKVELDRAGTIYLQKEAGDSYRYVVVSDSGEIYLDADEFAALLYRDRTERDWWKRVLNITAPIGIAWVAIGLLGQLLFSGRMLVQWVASEKLRRSVVPAAFWWLSLGGATTLLIYFSWRKDIIGILGQATGWMVYARNLYFIAQKDHP